MNASPYYLLLNLPWQFLLDNATEYERKCVVMDNISIGMDEIPVYHSKKFDNEQVAQRFKQDLVEYFIDTHKVDITKHIDTVLYFSIKRNQYLNRATGNVKLHKQLQEEMEILRQLLAMPFKSYKDVETVDIELPIPNQSHLFYPAYDFPSSELDFKNEEDYRSVMLDKHVYHSVEGSQALEFSRELVLSISSSNKSSHRGKTTIDTPHLIKPILEALVKTLVQRQRQYNTPFYHELLKKDRNLTQDFRKTIVVPVNQEIAFRSYDLLNYLKSQGLLVPTGKETIISDAHADFIFDYLAILDILPVNRVKFETQLRKIPARLRDTEFGKLQAIRLSFTNPSKFIRRVLTENPQLKQA